MSTRSALRTALPSTESIGSQRLAVLAVGVATAAVGSRFLVAVLRNTPVAVSTGSLAAGTAAVAAIATLAVGLSRDEPSTGVGLLFVGVFGLLGVSVPAAAVPAAVAVTAGTAVTVASVRDGLSRPAIAVTALLVLALGVALASGVGDQWTLRPAASTLALLGIAATPMYAATDTKALLRGCLAVAAVAAVGLSLPFVTGAVTLVGTGAVGSSLPVVALAVGGAVATASAALRRRRWPLLFGVALLAFAGVPATLHRAIPFALGVAALTTLEGSR